MIEPYGMAYDDEPIEQTVSGSPNILLGDIMLDSEKNSLEVDVFKILLPLFKLASGERVSVAFAVEDHNLIITYSIGVLRETKKYSMSYSLLTIADCLNFENILFRDFKRALMMLEKS